MVFETIGQWMVENLTAETMLIIFAFFAAFYPLFWMIYRYGINAEKKPKRQVAKTVSKHYGDVDIETRDKCG